MFVRLKALVSSGVKDSSGSDLLARRGGRSPEQDSSTSSLISRDVPPLEGPQRRLVDEQH